MQQQLPQSQMPTQAYATCAIGPFQVSFLFQSWACHWFIMLVHVMVLAFCFLASMWLPCSPMGDHLLDLLCHNSMEYTHNRHVPPGYGLWSMPGVHWVAATSTALSSGELHVTSSAVPSHSLCIMGHTAVGALQVHPIPVPSLHVEACCPLLVFHLITWSTQSLVEFLVILVWWFSVRVMNFLHLVGRLFFCLITHLPWYHGQGVNSCSLTTWTSLWSVFLCGSSSQWLRVWSWFYPLRLSWHSRTGSILWLGWCCPFLSLFRVSMLHEYSFWSF